MSLKIFHSLDFLSKKVDTGLRTVIGGEFDWGGRLLKSNGGAQWLTYIGWKSM